MANTYAPIDTIEANGATLTITQYNALYALMGTTFGGNGSSNFLIPDLCGRVPIGMGPSKRDGIFSYTEGQYAGATSMTMNANYMAPHNHSAIFTPTTTESTPLSVTIGVSTDTSKNVPSPSGNVISKGVDASGNNLKNFTTGGATSGAYLAGVTTSGGGGGITGGVVTVGINGVGMPFSLMQPYVVINYCMVTSGIFPSRP